MYKDCPHCNVDSFALKRRLKTTDNFYVVCDVHPLTEGHILIIPKNHLSCIGEYPGKILMEFQELYDSVLMFLKTNYGSAASFEHGIIGQTVFHSHIHLLPFTGKTEDIVPEGSNRIKPLHSLFDLNEIFEKEKGYLFFSIQDKMYVVDRILGAPRFFRDRFAKALGEVERGNWKTMKDKKNLMEKAEVEIESLISKWNSFA